MKRVADDAPAFLAPPLDLTRAIGTGGTREEIDRATAFTLGFVIPPRAPKKPSIPPPQEDVEVTIPGSFYKNEGEVTLRESPRDTLARSLFSIGPLDEAPDVSSEDRSPQERILLGRARAIRFRIGIFDLWPEESMRSRRGAAAAARRDPRLDALLDACAIAIVADGWPAREEDQRGDSDFAIVRATLEEIRSRVPESIRQMVYEAGGASFARASLLGFRRAVDYVRSTHASLSPADRASLFDSVVRVAHVPSINDFRAVALGELRRAFER